MKEPEQVLSIGNVHRLFRVDELNLELQELKIVKSSPNRHQKVYKEVEKWVRVGYFGDFKSAMGRVLQEQLNGSLDGNIHDLLAVVDDAKQEIFDAVDEAKLVLESFDKPEDGRGRKTVEVVKVDSEPPKKKKAVKKTKRKTAKAK